MDSCHEMWVNIIIKLNLFKLKHLIKQKCCIEFNIFVSENDFTLLNLDCNIRLIYSTKNYSYKIQNYSSKIIIAKLFSSFKILNESYQTEASKLKSQKISN